MVAERKYTAEAVNAEAVAFDAQDRIVVAGQAVMGFGEVAAMAAMFLPREWEEVAAYLLALVDREPVKTSPGFLPHRTILAHLGEELRGYARLAGEPVGLEADLRAASTKAEEERIRLLIFERQMGRERYLDAIQTEEQRTHEHPGPGPDTAPQDEEPPIDQEPAAPPTETDDADLAYL